jgi:hypothetical protein
LELALAPQKALPHRGRELVIRHLLFNNAHDGTITAAAAEPPGSYAPPEN